MHGKFSQERPRGEMIDIKTIFQCKVTIVKSCTWFNAWPYMISVLHLTRKLFGWLIFHHLWLAETKMCIVKLDYNHQHIIFIVSLTDTPSLHLTTRKSHCQVWLGFYFIICDLSWQKVYRSSETWLRSFWRIKFIHCLFNWHFKSSSYNKEIILTWIINHHLFTF